MFASGAAGLVWQIIWTARLGLVLGHEVVGVLSLMAAFFGGIAAGALLLGRRIETSLFPARWYAGMELLIAIWAMLVAILSPSLLPLVSSWMGEAPSAAWHWTVAFCVPFITLLPATMAMGATLPAMERLVRHAATPWVGPLYAINTAGAMVGLLLGVFLFLPHLGLFATSIVFAAVNAACAVGAWRAWGRLEVASSEAVLQPMESGVSGAQGLHASTSGVTGKLFLTGFLGIGYEVIAVRVLSQVTENTVYTYAVLLAVFLLGTAWGAGWLRRLQASPTTATEQTDRGLARLVVALLIGAVALWFSDRLTALPLQWFGRSATAALAGEALAGLAVMLLPAIAMGALFTGLCQQALASRLSLGWAVGVNTVGAALAPVVLGMLVLPMVGARITLLVVLAGYLALRSRQSWTHAFGWTVASVLLLVGFFSGPLRFVDVPPGGRVLSYREGVMAAVSVVEDADGVARLHINNRIQEGTSASGQVETRLAQLPLLLHPAPHAALFLGYGTGYTANAAALDPNLQVQAVELLPEVIDAAGIFALKSGAPSSAWPVKTVAADARRFVQSSADQYDVIVADLFHPARSGAGSLYTVEHFAAVKSRLKPGGLFCQWLALHQMDIETLRSIVAAYVQVYPNAVAILASNSLDTPVVGLISRPEQPAWQIESVRARMSMATPEVVNALRLARLDDEFAVLGSMVAGPQALKQFVSGATVNTDDRPVVTHRAPWVSYSAHEAPRDRLAALMQRLVPRADDILNAPKGPAAARLQAYWLARTKYLAFGMSVRPDADPRVMLNQLRQPLLDIVAMSADFHPATEPLLALAEAVREADPDLSAQVRADVQSALLSPSLVNQH